MSSVLSVTLASAHRRRASADEPLALLAPGGASVVLGTQSAADGLAVPVVPTERTLFAPRAACIAYDHSLWVADTGHHRLLGWASPPGEDGAPADYLVGQPTFSCEGRNAKRQPGPDTLNVPTGIVACGNGLALADSWNHRVLLWHDLPRGCNRAADVVLGQKDFSSAAPNGATDCASNLPRADTLFWPSGLAWDGAHLWVADTGNRRVLMWHGMPTRCAQPADLVIGQTNFSCRDENAGNAPNASSMRWPHGIAILEGRVCVADAGNNRVMVWLKSPVSDGRACDAMLGQMDPTTVDHNQGEYWPSAAALNMPYAANARGPWLTVADTANSRLLAWHVDDICGCGAPARRLAGQPDWQTKGDNRWQSPARDSLCWPYGLAGDGQHAVVADAGNNRVLLWRWSEEGAP